jgi:LmbE family N-acetylglucosaminyl deacetylase
MNWIFLSPHFDDVALSCGGLVWERASTGDTISIWTVCAGKPPRRELSAYAQLHHERWATGALAVEQRRSEDITSCAMMNASYRHFDIPDCIYRPRQKNIPHYYTSGDDIFGSVHPAEKRNLVRRLTRIFSEQIPPDAQVVCPLSLGNHVDHQITRRAAEQAAKYLDQALLFYADYPYAAQQAEQIIRYQQMRWECVRFDISEEGLEAWFASIAAHRSQISTFWAKDNQMQADIRAYSQLQKGLCLWSPPK